MDIDKQVFLKVKEKVILKNTKNILLKDLVAISANEDIKEKLENLVYLINIKSKSSFLIPTVEIISFIKQNIPNIDLVVIGKEDILVNIIDKKTNKYKLLRVILVCFLLFVGSITAIINFHSDVDIQQSHKIIYRAITGIETDKMLLLQIPYSLGIGVGMAVFFNNIFNKKINKEPTPLDMEIYSYQQNVDEYIKNNDIGE